MEKLFGNWSELEIKIWYNIKKEKYSMPNAFPIIGLLKKPLYLLVFGLIFAAIFYSNYYLMANLAGERDKMCVMGAGLTPSNLTFAFLMAFMAGLIVIGIMENSRNKSKSSRVKLGSTSILGLGLGSLTTFCTFCSLPALTLFGSSIVLSFITDYEIYIKLISLLLLGLGVYYVNKELKEGCKRCVS